jgi:DNA-binding Lrp family transcriptional regulator
MTQHSDARFALLNDWQRDFPLTHAPFASIAHQLGIPVGEVLDQFKKMSAQGAISRIGGVWGAGAAGAAMLCAFAVPPPRLEEVAAIVSAHPGVNHNYEREHHRNLWFVVTARDSVSLGDAVDRLERDTGCRALRLRMQRAYRIDLGFDLRHALAARGPLAPVHVPAVDDLALATLLEGGLPLVERPFDAWAETLGRSREALLATLQRWLRQGTLRRFGVIVRHHESGFAHNAMTVFDVPDGSVDACGEALAGQTGVTLAYRRERVEGWPYNLYCMMHGRDREAVHSALHEAIEASGLGLAPRAVLFSRRRFKQRGSAHFREMRVQEREPCRTA